VLLVGGCWGGGGGGGGFGQEGEGSKDYTQEGCFRLDQMWGQGGLNVERCHSGICMQEKEKSKTKEKRKHTHRARETFGFFVPNWGKGGGKRMVPEHRPYLLQLDHSNLGQILEN